MRDPGVEAECLELRIRRFEHRGPAQRLLDAHAVTCRDGLNLRLGGGQDHVDGSLLTGGDTVPEVFRETSPRRLRLHGYGTCNRYRQRGDDADEAKSSSLGHEWPL